MTTDLGHAFWRISHFSLSLFFEFLLQEQGIDGLRPFDIEGVKDKVQKLMLNAVREQY